MKKLLALVLVAVLSVAALCSCGGSTETNGDANSGVIVDTENKTVTIECTVANLNNHEHWFVVNEDGSMAKNAVLKTSVTTDELYTALADIAGDKVWNDEKIEFNKDHSIEDLLKADVGHADFAKFNVTVSWGGKDYDLSDVITDAQYMGDPYKGSYEVAFSGNLDNQHDAQTGCITCFGGCYMGITSGYDTPMMIEYTPKNLPDVGETVTVTYTLI